MGKENLFSEIFSRYDKEVVHIDREEENAAVMLFQESGDMDILEDVYIKRIPTLKNWALRFYYPGLELTIDDFMEELSIVFIKAANKYSRTKGSFNTCLYTFLDNRIKNMKNSTHAKKRRPINYDGPVSGILLSLDHVYSSDKNGGEVTLRDVLAKEEADEYVREETTHFRETVNILSEGDELIQTVLVQLGQGNTLSAILREFKTKKGDIEVTKKELDALKKSDFEGIKDLILEKADLESEEFSVLDHSINKEETISYVIEMKDSEEVVKIQKAIKYLRKNRDEYIRKIKEK